MVVWASVAEWIVTVQQPDINRPPPPSVLSDQEMVGPNETQAPNGNLF